VIKFNKIIYLINFFYIYFVQKGDIYFIEILTAKKDGLFTFQPSSQDIPKSRNMIGPNVYIDSNK